MFDATCLSGEPHRVLSRSGTSGDDEHRGAARGGSYRYPDDSRGMTFLFFFFQAEDGIRDLTVTGVQTCALPILFPENKSLHRWLDMAKDRIAFQGLPARICWIGLGDRHRAGVRFNEMVASGERSEERRVGKECRSRWSPYH